MSQANVFINWQYFRKGRVSGQVATLITVVVAVIFLFVVVTLNISRLSQKKTLTSNAADAAALRLASYLASYGNYLSWTYLDGGKKECGDWNWGGAISVLGFLVSAWCGGWLGYIGMLGSLGGGYYQTQVLPDKITDEYNKMFAKLSKDAQFSERAIAYALRMCVDDAEEITDVHDYDKDGDTTDKVRRFDSWYTARLKLLSEDSEAEESSRAMLVESLLDDIKSFAIDIDAFRIKQIEDATRPTMIEIEGACSDCGHPIQIVAAGPAAGINGKIIVLFNDLSDAGLKPDFWQPGASSRSNHDDLDKLTADLDNFYLFALGEKNGLITQSGADFNAFAENYDIWMPLLYTEEGASSSWYGIWQEQIARINSWQPELYGIIARLEENIAEAKDEEDEGREEKLSTLQARVRSAIWELDNLKKTLDNFNSTILVSSLHSPEESYVQEREATYSWQDAIGGWHHVRVKVSSFKMPRIKTYTEDQTYRSRQCSKLKNYAGDVTVSVVRYDQGVDTTFARKRPLWRFRYVKDVQAEERFDPKNAEQALAYGVKSTAKVSYTFNRLPKLEAVK